MHTIIKNKIFIGSKFDYLNHSFDDNKWCFVHIGTELFDKFNKNKVLSDNYQFENHFYLNWLDLPYSKDFNVKTLQCIFDFIDCNNDKELFIHCDYGQSRSPAILLCYLAKRTNYLDSDYEVALLKFKKIYPEYFDEGGITKFIRTHWDKIK
jgi:hypothetical protein